MRAGVKPMCATLPSMPGAVAIGGAELSCVRRAFSTEVSPSKLLTLGNQIKILFQCVNAFTALFDLRRIRIPSGTTANRPSNARIDHV